MWSTYTITTSLTVLPFNTVEVDTWGNVNTWTYSFIAPSDWNYNINFIARITGLNSWDNIVVYSYIDTSILQIIAETAGWASQYMSFSRVTPLLTWEAVTIKLSNQTWARWSISWTSLENSFSWYKL
jgi:hypothetical protein